MIQLILFQALLIFPVCILLICMPYWTRRTDSFGVTIHEDMYNHPFIQTMRKRFVLHMTTISVLLMMILLFSQQFFTINAEMAVFTSALGMIALLIIHFVYYVIFHQRMKLFKKDNVRIDDKKQVVVVQTSFHTENKALSNAWFIIPFVIIIGTIIFTKINYHLFPRDIPINFNFFGEATRWVHKSEVSVLFIPLIQLYLLIIFMFVNIIIRTAKQQIDPNNQEQSLQQNIVFRRRWSGFLIIVGIVMISLLSFTQYTLAFQVSHTIQAWLYMSMTVFTLVGSLVLSFKMGQGGSRIQVDAASSSKETASFGDDDKYWKLGMFYVNKKDPSLFVEKRFGIGWSVNCARPLVWLIFGALIGFIILINFLIV